MRTTTVSRLGPGELPGRLADFRQESAFEDLCRRTPVLHQVETDFAGIPVAPPKLRIGAWNLERCKHGAATAARLKALDLDLLLLSEMDDGMARSGNRNTARDLAGALGFTYAFGVEFIETGHGTESERALFAGQPNLRGLHGNAILSRFDLSRLDLLRLPGGEVWTDMDWHDSRLGSRIALAGVVTTAAGPMAVVSMHFESLPGPAERGEHMRLVTAWLDRSFPGLPVLMGGDVNSADLPEARDEDATHPAWFLRPEDHEPLFRFARDAGLTWATANTAQHTRRQIGSGRPFRPFKKVDWLFVRGMAAGRPLVYPAVDENGSPISDHELIVAEIELAAPSDGPREGR